MPIFSYSEVLTAGATATARPEGTEVSQDGALFIAFTSDTPGDDGGPDKAVFADPKGEEDYEAGWVMKINEDGNDLAALAFKWEMFATGGEPTDGGMGFANPDNLAFDNQGNLWVVTDMSTGGHNEPVPAQRKNKEGKPMSSKDLLRLYGNNSLGQIATSGKDAGEAKMFAYGPMECELTGPLFTEDGSALFIGLREFEGKKQNRVPFRSRM